MIMNQRFFIVLALFLLFLSFVQRPAQASCVVPEEIPVESYSVSEIWPITHSYDENVPGCFARIKSSNNEHLVYLPFEFSCKQDLSLDLKLSQACCDTGRDGDYACGVIPTVGFLDGLLGDVNKDTQTNLSAVPTEDRYIKDVIDQLVKTYDQDSMLGVGGVTYDLSQIAKKPTGRTHLEKYIPKFRELFKKQDYPHKQDVGYLLQVLNVTQDEYEINKSFLGADFYFYEEQKVKAHKFFQSNPNLIDDDVINIIRRSDYYSDNYDMSKLVFDTYFAAEKELIHPYIRVIYKTLTDGFAQQKYSNQETYLRDMDNWKKLVCDVYNRESTPTAYRRVVFDVTFNPIPNVDCFNKELLPK
ncbi:MAG: hypothetical protein CMP22_04030 [Rickettsiales bacterium]|nr:hypothetical protein [Rickettsiales bacterium]|tara:strand:+ start:224 stop:1297 length:1074 start_codon:yes stop_codon:yes gene_type:complete